ncbi:Hypothetical predicted protein [Drosophila guanche]|uniref:Uncharacterized protein n=1 Tax=Drosophila guanche TaxID=7266 RepID=A0A3B0J694_DROGU|nr:Hypothetical predicted protein [Drosophila guanche]
MPPHPQSPSGRRQGRFVEADADADVVEAAAPAVVVVLTATVSVVDSVSVLIDAELLVLDVEDAAVVRGTHTREWPEWAGKAQKGIAW